MSRSSAIQILGVAILLGAGIASNLGVVTTTDFHLIGHIYFATGTIIGAIDNKK